MPHLGHDRFDILQEIIHPEAHKRLRLHDCADRQALMDKARHGKGVMGSSYKVTAALVGKLHDRRGDLGTFADHKTGGIHLYGT